MPAPDRAPAHTPPPSQPAPQGAGSGPEWFVGVMSGTSLDGVDAVLADFSHGQARVLHGTHADFPPALRAELLALQASGPDELHRAALAARDLADACAQAILDTLTGAGIPAHAVQAAGVHGQTVRHRPELGYTLQIIDAARVAERSGVDVVADFRSRDVAAGGQGAPLVPAFHAALLGADQARAVLNLGGMGNLTLLPPRGSDDPVQGFDTGPANVLLDLWARKHLGRDFDANGAWAASEEVDPELLALLLDEPFLRQAPPRSTGRDLFHDGWLAGKLALRARAGAPPSPARVQSTLAQFTARTVADALRAHGARATEVLVCGGGVRNADLMRRLAAELAPLPVRSTEAVGMDPMHVEALAFAWLAREHLQGRAAGRPAVTGAAGPRVLGARYPR